MKGGSMEIKGIMADSVDTSTFEMRFAHGLFKLMVKASELQGGKVDPLMLEVAWAAFIVSVFEQFGLKVPTKEDIEQVRLLFSNKGPQEVN
jgi:hypothetical protein